jgi:hypothetical protein
LYAVETGTWTSIDSSIVFITAPLAEKRRNVSSDEGQDAPFVVRVNASVLDDRRAWVRRPR